MNSGQCSAMNDDKQCRSTMALTAVRLDLGNIGGSLKLPETICILLCPKHFVMLAKLEAQ